MASAKWLKIWLATTILLLLVALIQLAVVYPKATRILVKPAQQDLVDRAVREAAVQFRTTPREQARSTFPIVMELHDRKCVELRSTLSDGGGNYIACYDNRTGKQLYEMISSGF